MRFALLILLLSSRTLLSQPVFSDNGLIIKPNFAPGDIKSFIVTEDEKTSELFVFIKGSHRFHAQFKILDTVNGYTINFIAKLLDPINDKVLMWSLIDKLRDSINLIYKLSKAGWLLDIKNYRENQRLALYKLDSLLFTNNISKDQLKVIHILRDRLRRPDGLELLLKPIMLFNEIYLKPPFRNRNDYHAASTHNIFYEPQVAGTMITNLRKIDTLHKTAKVTTEFIGNSDSALKWFTPAYNDAYFALKGKYPKGSPEKMKFEINAEYEIQTTTGYPLVIFMKTITTYIARSISTIKMEMME